MLHLFTVIEKLTSEEETELKERKKKFYKTLKSFFFYFFFVDEFFLHDPIFSPWQEWTLETGDRNSNPTTANTLFSHRIHGWAGLVFTKLPGQITYF